MRFGAYADSTKQAGYPHFLRRKIQSIEELAQIEIKLNIQLVVPTDLHALDQTAHGHFFASMLALS